MKQVASTVAVVLILTLIAPVGGQPPLHAPAHDLIHPVAFGLSEEGTSNQISPTRTWDATPRPMRLELAARSVAEMERPGALGSDGGPPLPAVGVHLDDASYLRSGAQPTAPAPDRVSRPPAIDDLRAEMQVPGTPVEAPAPPSEIVPLLSREIARCEPASSRAVGFKVSGVLTFTYVHAAQPGTGGEKNYTGPGPDTPRVTEPTLELCLTLTSSPSVSFFADLTAKVPSDSAAVLSIERLYVDVRDTLGVRDLRVRLGRDRATLGSLGLLLDEALFEDQRDGVEVWLPPLGPVRLFGFFQYALLDRSTTRRVWGARAESEVFAGWTLGANYRADTAAAGDMGPCPSTDCTTGSGFGMDVVGKIARGVTLTVAYGSYTQTRDVARPHFQAELEIDFKELAGIQQFEPGLTIWYKNFSPYTIPGGAEGSVPRGGFLTPDDFKLFNVNDNLIAVGARLDLQLLSNVAFFALGEWGTYKDSGPTYKVYSAGVEVNFPDNFAFKLTYNAYTVAGGSVTTSPVSGITLSNATVYQAEVVKSW